MGHPVTFSWEEIRDMWLKGGQIAHSQEEIVREFNRVERILGRGWMEGKLTPAPGVAAHGALPTLEVVRTGQLLASVEDLQNADTLIRKLRSGRDTTWAELKGAYLLKSANGSVSLEHEPIVTVGNKQRKPDFRVRTGDEPWTYVEITRPDTSEDKKRVDALAQVLFGVLDAVPGEYAIEVFLRRQPSEPEVGILRQEVEDICRLQGLQIVELQSDLGTLYLNQVQPGELILDDHGEPYTPRSGAAQAISEGGRTLRHVAVRVAFSDSRADEFLRKEAKQLPTDAPGLIMVDMSQASGGMRTWRPLLERRLQPNLHTRVSGICLFQLAFFPSDAGETWRIETKVLVNRYATMELPAWLTSSLRRHESTDDDIKPP
jgi:hypothetical protein